ncbi:MerR family transcriptional regulator [Streptococcus mutans]|uniref:MerR family transcriptional regulator n=1 Tax=Streptococcus mutans TaxID=1309 RepID=UPI00145580D7|nr:MerR family transcriptional regulator [Streptococcus mutans]NLQ47916.1 MerR family transcriptional regulator [Streptococcus mutans]
MSTLEAIKLQKIEDVLSLLVTLAQQNKESSSKLDIITQKELLKQLDISPNTLKSWEKKGLKRLEPPIEGTRTVYYQLSHVLQFLSH